MSKVWFVTGTSTGFGRLWAEAALERGDRVVATARNLDRLPDYARRREETSVEFEVGEAAATVPAVLALVDSDQPPRRLILGRLFPAIEEIYEDRLRTWRDWQPVSLAAFGTPGGR